MQQTLTSGAICQMYFQMVIHKTVGLHCHYRIQPSALLVSMRVGLSSITPVLLAGTKKRECLLVNL